MDKKETNSVLFSDHHTFRSLILEVLCMRNFLGQKIDFWTIKSGFSQGSSFEKKLGFLGEKLIFGSQFLKFWEFCVAYSARFWKTANKATNSVLFSDHHTFRGLILEVLWMRNFLGQKIDFWTIKVGLVKARVLRKNSVFWVKNWFLAQNLWSFVNFVWHIVQGFGKRPPKTPIRFYLVTTTLSEV